MSGNCSDCAGVHDAVEKGCIGCVERILEENRELKDEVHPKTGHTPLIAAVLSNKQSKQEIIRCLVQFRADVNKELKIPDSDIASRTTPLGLAVEKNNLEAIKGLNSGQAGKCPIKTQVHPSYLLSRNLLIELLNLNSAGKLNLEMRNENNFTPLQLASQQEL